MAGSSVSLNIILLTLCSTLIWHSKLVETSRLNVPRVLLPVFNDFPVNFTLEVTEGGCYQWSTSRLDIIHLIPINENPDRTCSSAVMVQSITKEPVRNTAIVLAEDINTGQFLRCDVIVDAIFSLNLVTTTRELFIEEAPEAFEVRAYDEQGNEFTTLAGVEFVWTIGSREKRNTHLENEYNSILRFMTFQESPYETPSTIISLDNTGRQGHIILLEGIKTGTAKVSVRSAHSEYKHVPPVEVELIVVANLIILPTDVTMMAYDSFKYRIMQVHQGRLEEISLPSTQYYLEAENPLILEINNDRHSAYALGKGKTKVVLHDKNVHEEYGVVLPTATININEVSYITITVLPNRNSGLILEETHELVVELFDSKDHKFHIGEGVEVSLSVDPQFFETKSSTQNGSHVVVVPITCGTSVAEARLLGVINKEGKKIPLVPQLSAKAELVIHTPVTISPRILAVPWDPRSKTRFDIALKASGGDGKYVWDSRQPSIVTVSQNGVVRILNEGSTEVVVSMSRNPYNNDRARVHVLLPSRLEIIQYNMDAAIGEPIDLHVALYGKIGEAPDSKEIPFNDCREIPFEIYIPDGNFVQNTSENLTPVGISCATIRLIGLDVGTSSITVAYSSNGQYLMDNITIAAYERLVAVHPSNGETLLAVGSSRKIIFKGGPHPWPGKPQGYKRVISSSDPDAVRVIERQISDSPEIVVYEVVCRVLGDVLLTYTISNAPLLPNCRSTDATATVRVICGKPRYVHLAPEFKDSEHCPIGQSSDRVMAHSDKSLRLVVTVKDEDGRRFDNFTSLNVVWNLKPQDSGSVEIASGTAEETFTDMNVVLPRTHYQILVPKRHTGSLVVSAKVVGYQNHVLAKQKISPEWPPFAILNERDVLKTPLIEAEIVVYLVNDTTITPKKIKVLNDPTGKYSLQVSQGSGYYEFVLSSEEIADIRYVEPTKTISIVPKKPGVLRLGLVDLCLVSSPAEAEIEVQQLAGIEIDTIDKVEKGKCILATIKLYDTNGHLMELPSLDALELNFETDENHIDVKRLPVGEQDDAPYSRILYMIHGVKEGEARIFFTSGRGDQEIRSETAIIQVFTPLRVNERNLTILVGTVCQIETSGGPSDGEIEFSVEDTNILGIEKRGILEGKAVGKAKVIARAVGPSVKGQRIIYSQDHVYVQVTHLQGIKIVAPTTRIKVGATVPIWAFGIPDNLTPLIIGSMKSLLSFNWYTSDTRLLSLHNMYEGTGINIRYQNEVTLRAKAHAPGFATIYLNVTIPSKIIAGYEDQLSFGTFAKIEIFEELAIVQPSPATTGIPVLIMQPNSILKIKTNRDKHGVTSYKILANGSNESEDPNALTQAVKTVTIDKTGLVKSGENYGRTIVSITNVESYNLKQTVTVIIDVKPIHYMMLSLNSNIRIRSGEELNMLPKGMELSYVVEYFDSVGNKFAATNTEFVAAMSRSDLMSFAKGPDNILIAKFHKDGELVAKIHSDKYPNGMFDYVHMTIGDIIFPTKTSLTIGDVVCFSMPLLSSETGDPGSWQSLAPEILSVDSITGIGRAKSPGHTIVKHSLTTHKQGEIEVNVQPIAKISLVLLKGKNFTGTEIFSVPLVLKSKDEGVKENNVLARGLSGCRTHTYFSLSSFPFTCHIQFITPIPSINIKDIFLTKPRFDIVTGFYYCDIIPIGAPTILMSTLETKVLVNAQSREVEGTPLEVAYLPPICVSTKEIVFVQPSSQSPSTAILEVHGLPMVLEQVMVDVPEGAVISSRQFVTKNLVNYKLRLTQDHNDIQGQKIIVLNELTKQNISILIRISKHESYVPYSGIHWIDYIYFHRYTFGTLAVLMITFFYLWKNKVSSVNLSVRNNNVFADRCPPPMKKSPTLNSTTLNSSLNASSPRSPGSPSPLRPFSAFEPVYGDPRGFYTPNTRRNYCFQTP
ncbi:nuclear pore membrane glycoprotein 210 [Venturia canescens]|uniref:nuclear pore membrane glycoprotein 210 n=1 Tax=Venturia canescens TaxID=32260 RepID=UPI001C9C5D5D|nr:nuclear pore membrane glycoprotein 210 [Venturia canescens]